MLGLTCAHLLSLTREYVSKYFKNISLVILRFLQARLRTIFWNYYSNTYYKIWVSKKSIVTVSVSCVEYIIYQKLIKRYHTPLANTKRKTTRKYLQDMFRLKTALEFIHFIIFTRFKATIG